MQVSTEEKEALPAEQVLAAAGRAEEVAMVGMAAVVVAAEKVALAAVEGNFRKTSNEIFGKSSVPSHPFF